MDLHFTERYFAKSLQFNPHPRTEMEITAIYIHNFAHKRRYNRFTAIRSTQNFFYLKTNTKFLKACFTQIKIHPYIREYIFSHGACESQLVELEKKMNNYLIISNNLQYFKQIFNNIQMFLS